MALCLVPYSRLTTGDVVIRVKVTPINPTSCVACRCRLLKEAAYDLQSDRGLMLVVAEHLEPNAKKISFVALLICRVNAVWP
jgi:hypothetical protein